MELTGELSLTVKLKQALKQMGRRKDLLQVVTKVHGVVGAEIMPSNITLGSLCGHILML